MKSASRQKKAHADNMPIEAPRWALLKQWYRPEDILVLALNTSTEGI